MADVEATPSSSAPIPPNTGILPTPIRPTPMLTSTGTPTDGVFIGRFLVVCSTLSLMGMLAALAFHEIPSANKDLFNYGLAAVVTSWVTIVGFRFGAAIKANGDKP